MNIVKNIVGVAIGLFVAAIIMPVALIALASNTTAMTAGGVSSSVITVLTVLLPILAVVGIALYFLPRKG